MDRISDFIFEHAQNVGNRIAIYDRDERITWQEFAQHVEREATDMKKMGLKPGHRVAMRGRDGAAYLITLMAVLHAGGIHVPIDINLTQSETDTIIESVGTRWFVHVPLHINEGIFLVPTDHQDTPDPLGKNKSAFIRFSSGVNGPAKGVVLSHKTVIERVEAVNKGMKLSNEDRVLWCLPIAYHFASSICHYIRYGVAIVFGSHHRIHRTLQIAQEAQATTSYLSPSYIHRLVHIREQHRHLRFPDTMRFVISTSAPLSRDVAAEFTERFGIPVYNGFSGVELGLTMLSPPAEKVPNGFFGKPFPDFECATFDEYGKTCAVNTPGELGIRGPGIFDAYLNPWRLRSDIIGSGFFRTGDNALIDEKGEVRLLGRAREIISVSGVKIYPMEVESVLASHPAIAHARVCGAPDKRSGEHIVAEIQPKRNADHPGLLTEVKEYCKKHLAPHKQPSEYRVVSDIPVTQSGKVKRSTKASNRIGA